MGKLYVHIGLPKTATSTLQVELFNKIVSEKLEYLGVQHPRDKKQDILYYKFMNSVNTGTEIEQTKSLLKHKLDKYDLLISEEMLVVTSASITWREKLQNLSLILKGLDFSIIISVREPASAMFSYYLELYAILKKRGSFLDIALKDDAMRIYYYKEFLSFCIDKFSKTRINLIKFEDIIKNDITDITKIIGYTPTKITFSNINSKILKNEKIITNSNINISQLFMFVTRVLKLNKIRFLKRFKGLYKILLNKTKNIILKQDKVNIVSTEVLDQIRIELKDQTDYLRDNYKIDYSI
ncbi:hypothetical protein [Saccharicrinis sp. FJH54]|uniref:hypothetical protein n=1 Tax=Saccharicrinis sp. FJH54 TaxID=3344665 RepID=UPI0035D522AC